MNPLLIVGAGPVGMTLACELARYRVPLRIIDKSASRTDKSKALVVWSRTLELLDRSGGAAPFIDAGFKVQAVNIVAHDKILGRPTMDAVDSQYKFGLMLPQSQTERLLEERLASLGIPVERQVELLSFKADPAGVDAVLRHADGRQEQIHTDWLLGCDGAHSAVRHGVGATFAGETMNADFVLADAHLSSYPYPETEVSVFWHRDGVLVLFPITPGRFRVIADLPFTGGEKPPTPTLEDVQRILDQRGTSGMKLSDPIWLAGFRINGRKVANYRWGRAFLLGDAAHVHSPAGGQGMNTGMQDAFNLAWKLALVVHGHAPEALLDSFSPERSAVGDEVLQNAGRLTAIATIRNPVAQTIRNAVARLVLGIAHVRHAIADQMTEVTIGYPHSPLNGPGLSHHPHAGERIAPIAGQTPIGAGDRPLFALFAEPSAAVDALCKRFADILEPTPRPPLHGQGLWLARPDGYVACSASDVETIASYLGHVTQSGHA